MHKLYELKEKLMRELEDYSENGKFSKDDVEAIKYITSAIDHICNIVEREEGGEYSSAGGGSYAYNDGGSYARGGGRSNTSYRSYRSYAGGRGQNARRDSMGRYSSAGEDFRMELESLIDSAPNEHVKQRMREIMSEI